MTATSDLGLVLSKLNRNRHFEDFDDVCLFRLMSDEAAIKAAALIAHSRAQLRQDLLVAALHGFKSGGYFVEVGATDGLYLSNTHLLERQLGWRGILAEPARCWHETLHRERTAVIETRCVHRHSGESVVFREVEADQALSTIVDYADSDLHEHTRQTGEDYTVRSISLLDLLGENNAPAEIDFLSIDTEGSELDILEGFDFLAHRFSAIACEHNYTENRNAILSLLSGHGYVRVLNHISMFDDWYVHESCLSLLGASFPEWESQSDQKAHHGEPELVGNQKMIRVLSETVRNLIVERDAYKTALEARIAAEVATTEPPE